MTINYSRYLQAGGGLPLVSYTPFAGGTPTLRASSESSRESSSSLKLDDLLGLLKNLNALNSDNKVLTNKIILLYLDGDLYDSEGNLDTSQLISTYYQSASLVAEANRNAKLYEDAVKQAEQNGALNEVAINQYGQVQCVKDGRLVSVSVKDFLNNPEDYQALSNNDLLSLRNTSMAFDNSYLPTVTNGVGFEKVTKLLNDVISRIGTDTRKLEGYTARQTLQVEEGLQILTAGGTEAVLEYTRYATTVDGLYKSTELTKTLANQISAALNYLWNTLPANVRSYLELRGGNAENPSEGGKLLIALLAASQGSTTLEYSIDLQKDLDIQGNRTSSGNGSSDKSFDSNPYLQLMRGLGGEPGNLTIITRNGQTGILVRGTWHGQIPKVNSDMSIDALLGTGLQSIVSSRDAITFGDRVIGSDLLKDVLYDNKGGTVATLPMKRDYTTGKMVVNLDVIEDYAQFTSLLRTLRALLDNNQITQELYDASFARILEDSGLSLYLDANGRPDYSLFGEFLLVDAYTTDKALRKSGEDFDLSLFVEKVRNPDTDLENKLIRGLSTDKDKKNYSVDVDDWGLLEFFSDDIYRGTVYIPLIQNQNAAINGWGDQIKDNFVYNLEENYQMWNRARSAGSTDASLL